ncbi:MAG TPA: amidohydrolase family protein [Thermomicrobiales bacterium]|nr:amidohydrolase family protein [Thermomicrobiales bacterium]
MIIDVHTHTPRYREAPSAENASLNAMWRPDQARSTAHTWDDHIAALAPVDRAIVFNIASDPRQGSPDDGNLIYPGRRANDDTAAFVRAHPEKFIGFLTVHPHDPAVLDEIERATGDLGLRGIKLGPNYQNFDPLGEGAFTVYRRAEELRLPILFHQGTSPVRFADLDYAHPRHIDRVATAFPELRMILAHMGHPWQVDCIAVIRKHPNVYADISAQFYRPWSYYNAFRLATEWDVLPKLLFGSDYPIATPQETMDALGRVNDITAGSKLPRVPEEALEQIVHRDSLALLGLE